MRGTLLRRRTPGLRAGRSSGIHLEGPEVVHHPQVRLRQRPLRNHDRLDLRLALARGSLILTPDRGGPVAPLLVIGVIRAVGASPRPPSGA